MYSNNRKFIFILSVVGIVFAIALTVCGIYGYQFYQRIEASLPDVRTLKTHESPVPSIILSRDGVKIGEIFEERRYPVTLDQMSPWLKNAFLAAEDVRFYEHKGVDVQGLMRAVKSQIRHSKTMQGGSTITQQLAKTLLLTKERTYERKIKDMLLAMRIEKTMTKDEILELYLNTIFLGNNSYGVEAAARNYFRKSANKLSLAEAAMIAGVTPAPSAFAPTENLDKAKARQKYVLEQMVRAGWATQQEAQAAFVQPLKIYHAESPNTTVAPHFFIEVQKQLEKQLALKDLPSQGYVIHTTIDTRLQSAAAAAVAKTLKGLESKKGYKGAIKQHGRNFTESLRKMLSMPTREDEHIRAIVVDLYPRLGAAAIVTQEGLGLLLEDDHSWALSRAKTGERKVRDFADIVSIGDEIHVRRIEREAPKKIEKATNTLRSLNKFAELYPAPPSFEGYQFYTLTDTEAIEAAVLIMDSKNGEVLAMVGGNDFQSSQFNRATLAKRQVGSGVKPLYYAYALDHGFSPASQVSSPPLVLGNWKPENYSKDFIGQTTLRTSLINSYNISSIQIYQTLGPAAVQRHLRKLGLAWPADDLSVALGSGDATLLQMVQAYSPFANDGMITEAVYITRVEDKEGEVLFDMKTSPELRVHPVTERSTKSGRKSQVVVRALDESKKILSPEAAFVTVKMMQDVIRFGTGRPAYGASMEAGGKTGTTNGYSDAWFLGVVPNMVGGVWVGFDDARKSLGTDGTGGKMAAPLWRDVMKAAVELYPSQTWPEPQGITYIRIEPETGELSTSGGGIRIPVVAGTEPGSPTARNALGVFESSGGEEGQDQGAPSNIEDSASLRALE